MDNTCVMESADSRKERREETRYLIPAEFTGIVLEVVEHFYAFDALEHSVGRIILGKHIEHGNDI